MIHTDCNGVFFFFFFLGGGGGGNVGGEINFDVLKIQVKPTFLSIRYINVPIY